MNNKFIFLLFFLGFVQVLHAQYRKVLHETFELNKAPEINLDLVGDMEVETWAGNVVMTETTVFLNNASASVLNHFVEGGRYAIGATDPDSTVIVVLTSKVKERDAVKFRKWVEDKQVEVEVVEEVAIKVFVPEEYEAADESKTVWQLKPEFLKIEPSPADTTQQQSSPQ